MEYEEIMEKLNDVVSTEVHPIDEEALEREKKKFFETHKKSLDLFEDAKNVIPGGVEHNLSTTHPFPLAIDRVKGYRMWDIDGNEYICLLYTSDAADDLLCVDLGGRRIIKKKK